MGRNQKYQRVRIPKHRLKSRFPHAEPPTRPRITITNTVIPFTTVTEATREIRQLMDMDVIDQREAKIPKSQLSEAQNFC